MHLTRDVMVTRRTSLLRLAALVSSTRTTPNNPLWASIHLQPPLKGISGKDGVCRQCEAGAHLPPLILYGDEDANALIVRPVGGMKSQLFLTATPAPVFTKEETEY